MMIDRRAVMAAIPISLFFAESVAAAPKHRHASHRRKFSWDGTWSGNWGGQKSEATSVTIANNRVVRFEYNGVSSVSASTVTPTTVSYNYNGVSVMMRRTAVTTAMASLHGPMGNATAQLTKQEACADAARQNDALRTGLQPPASGQNLMLGAKSAVTGARRKDQLKSFDEIDEPRSTSSCVGERW